MKMLVFKTKGNWIREIAKAYVAYMFLAIFGTFVMYVLYEKYEVNVWISQLSTSVVVIAASYLTNSKFTFYAKN